MTTCITTIRKIACLAFSAAWTAFVSASGCGYSNDAIEHVRPMNVFPAGVGVEFAVRPGERAQKGFAVTDYYGRKFPAAYDRGDGRLRLGELPVGYYEIANGDRTTSFGVVPFTDMSAAEFRKANRRFGLKVYQLGAPGVWWHRPWTWELDECVTACEKMGLQWTRHAFNARRPGTDEPGVISTLQLVNDHAVNCVMKIEGIPESAYDAKRYGPMDKFRETKNKRGWQRCSVPVAEPYRRWLADEVAKLPEAQNVFEMGNEVWDYMTAAEFAEWCQIAVPVLRKVRPGCSVGADPGRLPWCEAFAKAGGFNGMDAMYIHPYSFTPAPEVRIRAWLRNRREYCEALAGRKLDVYVTEYGWPTAPRDKRGHSCDERRQAQRTVRESLMLYAEGCRTLIPHWMADREQDPTEREHWFGFFRLVGEPKPVVIAHAACARMIDGSTFVGDLILPGAETNVGSMAFRRADGWVVALWTQDEEPLAGRMVEVPAVPDAVYGIMGDSREFTAGESSTTLKVSADVVYLVGRGELPASLLKAVDASGELSETRWNNRLDGNRPTFAVERQARPVALRGGDSGDVPKFAAWHDETALRFRLEVPSACIVKGRGEFLLDFSTRPDRQPQMDDWAYFDYRLAATCRDGVFSVALHNPAFPKGRVDLAPGDSAEGIAWSARTACGAAVFEIRLPKKTLRGFGSNKKGLMSGQVCWTTEGRNWRLNSGAARQNWEWPLWRVDR